MADLETFRSETAAWLDANAPEFAKTPFKDTSAGL